MRDFSGTAVTATSCCGYLEIKNLILAIMLITIGTALPIGAFAKLDSATLEKQRAENKARLAKNEELRSGKAKKSLFSLNSFNNSAEKADAAAYKARTLKLDALSPSPRRHAK